jgi:hypothetical protein
MASTLNDARRSNAGMIEGIAVVREATQELVR